MLRIFLFLQLAKMISCIRVILLLYIDSLLIKLLLCTNTSTQHIISIIMKIVVKSYINRLIIIIIIIIIIFPVDNSFMIPIVALS